MPTFFKIFLFLFLQQGMKTGKTVAGTGSVNWESVLLAGNATLTIQADPLIIEQVLNICTLHDISCEIKRDLVLTPEGGTGTEKATVDFKNLRYSVKNRMMDQLKVLQGKMDMQWREL